MISQEGRTASEAGELTTLKRACWIALYNDAGHAGTHAPACLQQWAEDAVAPPLRIQGWGEGAGGGSAPLAASMAGTAIAAPLRCQGTRGRMPLPLYNDVGRRRCRSSATHTGMGSKALSCLRYAYRDGAKTLSCWSHNDRLSVNKLVSSFHSSEPLGLLGFGFFVLRGWVVGN